MGGIFYFGSLLHFFAWKLAKFRAGCTMRYGGGITSRLPCVGASSKLSPMAATAHSVFSSLYRNLGNYFVMSCSCGKLPQRGIFLLGIFETSIAPAYALVTSKVCFVRLCGFLGILCLQILNHSKTVVHQNETRLSGQYLVLDPMDGLRYLDGY